MEPRSADFQSFVFGIICAEAHWLIGLCGAGNLSSWLLGRKAIEGRMHVYKAQPWDSRVQNPPTPNLVFLARQQACLLFLQPRLQLCCGRVTQLVQLDQFHQTFAGFVPGIELNQ